MTVINSIKPAVTSFKGEYRKNTQGIPYYHTNSGIKAATVLGIIDTVGAILNFSQKKTQAGVISLITAGLAVACGALYDNIRNKKTQKVANDIHKYGIQKTIMMDEHVQLSAKNHPYYNSHMKTFGALTGAAVGLISGTANIFSKDFKLELDKIGGKKPTTAVMLGGLIGTMLANSIGGLIMATISDHNSNNDSFNNA